MDLSQGGHLTHGSPVNFSGLLYNAVSYGVTDDGLLDYDRMRAHGARAPAAMIIAGYSAYSRVIDWAQFRAAADEVGRVLMVDMAHFAGLARRACTRRRCRSPTW
jgi:glycine hydroxymethyltransferase